MNWNLVYKKIIKKIKEENRKKSRDLYYENHHIFPRCLGGTDEEINMVLLTTREHFFLHKLLTKMYSNTKLVYALRMMSNMKRYNCSKEDMEKISIQFSRIGSQNCPFRRLSKEVIKKRSETRSKNCKENPEIMKRVQETRNRNFENLSLEDRALRRKKQAKALIESAKRRKKETKKINVPKTRIYTRSEEWRKHQSDNHWLKGKKLPEEVKIKGQITQSLGKVLCIETGEVFMSSKEAESKHKGWHHGPILQCCKGNRKTHLGYHFQWYKEEK